MTEPTKLTYVVPPEQAGWKLRSVLLTGMNLSRKLLIRLRGMEGMIRVNGSSDVLYRPLQAGDTVEVELPVETSDTILPQPMDIEVIHEDDYLLIVNKPAGLIVHPTVGHYTNTMANGIVHYWQAKGESYKFRPIHRLDQDTSGVIAVAKNGYAHQFVSEQFQKGEVKKTYIAVVYGRVERDAGVIEGPIDRDPDEPHVRIVTPGGAPSTTHYEVVERYDRAREAGDRPYAPNSRPYEAYRASARRGRLVYRSGYPTRRRAGDRAASAARGDVIVRPSGYEGARHVRGAARPRHRGAHRIAARN